MTELDEIKRYRVMAGISSNGGAHASLFTVNEGNPFPADVTPVGEDGPEVVLAEDHDRMAERIAQLTRERDEAYETAAIEVRDTFGPYSPGIGAVVDVIRALKTTEGK